MVREDDRRGDAEGRLPHHLAERPTPPRYVVRPIEDRRRAPVSDDRQEHDAARDVCAAVVGQRAPLPLFTVGLDAVGGAHPTRLNSSQPGCCDKCEIELTEQIAANPNVLFAFDRGGLRAVA